jgi:hypothetical protein
MSKRKKTLPALKRIATEVYAGYRIDTTDLQGTVRYEVTPADEPRGMGGSLYPAMAEARRFVDRFGNAKMKMSVRPGYAYRGATYLPDHDFEDGSHKVLHVVEFGSDYRFNCGGRAVPSGFTRAEMDWSPHSTPTVEQFHTWVDLGMPGRTGAGPLNGDDLLELAGRVNAGGRWT